MQHLLNDMQIKFWTKIDESSSYLPFYGGHDKEAKLDLVNLQIKDKSPEEEKFDKKSIVHSKMRTKDDKMF
jgi:hypothetical protein